MQIHSSVTHSFKLISLNKNIETSFLFLFSRKMTDRIFPGSGVNSFLRQNGILKGYGEGSVKRLEDVASITPEEKSSLINPRLTVPVTSNDIEDSTIISQSGNTIMPVTPVPMGTDIEQSKLNNEPNVTESYTPIAATVRGSATTSTCPCKTNTRASSSPSCKCGKSSISSSLVPTPISKSIEKFVGNRFDVSLDGFNDNNSKAMQIIDSAALKVKETLTGAKKKNSDKNIIEGFCNEHWHSVSMSIVVLVAVVFVVISIMMFLYIMKIVCKCGKCCGKLCKKNKFLPSLGNNGEYSPKPAKELKGEIF